MHTVLQNYLDREGYAIVLKRMLSRMYVDDNGCWIFTGCVDKVTGYGQVRIGRVSGKKAKAHRFIAYCFHGLDLFDLTLQACHTCDVRNCINPFHLWIGTKSENFRDAVSKGRWHNQRHNNLAVKDWKDSSKSKGVVSI